MLKITKITTEAFNSIHNLMSESRGFHESNLKVFRMFYVENKSTKEIVETNGITKQRLSTILKLITDVYFSITAPQKGVTVNFSYDMPHTTAYSLESFFTAVDKLPDNERESALNELQSVLKERTNKITATKKKK